MSGGKIWGTIGLNNQVYEELVLRGNILKEPRKTPEQLSYLNANVPWIVLQSGIDVGGSADTAKSYMLTGGRTSARSQIGLAGESAISTYYPGSFGLRPMPGIVGVSVRCRDNTFGSILEAEVSIKAWSLEDLECLDQIYFKPGFTAVLEWGWTLTWKDGLQSGAPKPLEFFGNEKLPELQKKIQSIRNPNHEIVLGYITNFSYSLQKDGSYDCTVKILGTGAVIEGIAISAVDKLYIRKSKREVSNDETSAWIAPFYEAITNCSKIGDVSNMQEVFDQFGATWNVPVGGEGTKTSLSDIKVLGYTVFFRDSFFKKRKESLAFVRFEDLLKMINTFDLNGMGTNYQFASSTTKDGKYDNFYVTCDAQFSLDPYKVIVPARVKDVIVYEESEKKMADGTKALSVSSTRELSKNASKYPTGKVGRIFDLWVSVNYLYDVIQAEIDSNPSSFSVFGYFKSLLSGISKALGNINDFDLGIDEQEGLLYVVDRNYVKISEDLPKISASGLDTSVIDISANSEVSSELASMMSIAAQGSKEVSPTLTAWNRGLTERHPLPDENIDKRGNTQITTSETKIDMDAFWEAAKSIYVKFFEGEKVKERDSSTAEYSNNIYLQLQLAGEKLFAEQVDILYEAADSYVGVFPVKVELTFKGIANFVVGEAFSLKSGILPRRYDAWGYIVTGVSHDVKPDGWKTTVTTQYFPGKVKNLENKLLEGVMEESTSSRSETSSEVRSSQVSSVTLDPENPTWNYKIFRNTKVNSTTFSEDPVRFIKGKNYNVDTTGHNCSGGSFLYARLLCAGDNKNLWEKILPSRGMNGKVPEQGTVSAKDPAYFNKLQSLGYREIEGKEGVSIETIKGVQSKMMPGDVISYWGGPLQKYHTCVRRAKVTGSEYAKDRRWMSDFLQYNMFVYR